MEHSKRPASEKLLKEMIYAFRSVGFKMALLLVLFALFLIGLSAYWKLTGKIEEDIEDTKTAGYVTVMAYTKEEDLDKDYNLISRGITTETNQVKEIETTNSLDIRDPNKIKSTAPIPTPTPKPKSKPKSTSSDTFKWFSYLIMREAGGEGNDIQLAVGQVILNRSKSLSKSITDIVFEKNNSGYVFTPVGKSSFKSTKPSQTVLDNSKYLLNGGSYNKALKANSLYFCTSAIYRPGIWHYDASIGKGTHTIKEDFRLPCKNGGYVIFFSRK